MSSDKQPDFQSRHRILVCSVAAYDRPPASSRWLIESCRRFGIELRLLGEASEYINDRCKIAMVAEYLATHPQFEYVLCVDFRDVILCATLPEMFAKYRSMGKAIVAAGECVCWPIADHAERSPPAASSNRYLNSGTIFATSTAWQAAWQRMRAKELDCNGQPPQVGEKGRHVFSCDQAAWSDLYVNAEADIGLDTQCEIFQPLATIDRQVASANRNLLLEGRRVVNRETGGRPCVIHCNSDAPLDAWGNYVLDPSPAWIWPLIDKIRGQELAQLRDVDALEGLILELGLHAPLEGALPEAMLPYTCKGLAIWQQPRELAEYLVWLSARPPIGSYLEIGVESGGTFITTIEYLRRFHPLHTAIGLDPTLNSQVRDYVSRTAGLHFLRGTLDSEWVRRQIRNLGSIDLTLIDGDHADAAVRADWHFARQHSRYVVLHDVAQGDHPGPSSLWREIKSSFCLTREFVARNAPAWGLGLVDMAYGTHQT